MAPCVTRTAWHASVATLKYSSICQRTLQNAPAFLSVPKSTIILTPRRTLFGLLCSKACAYTGWFVYYNSYIFNILFIFIIILLYFLFNINETESGEEVSAAWFELMPPKFRLHRDVIFSLEDLFASLGGTTALFVGASVLTVVETVLFIIRHLVNFVIETIQNRR